MKVYVLTYDGRDRVYTEEDLVSVLGNNLPGDLLMDTLDTLDIGDQYGESGSETENYNVRRIE